MCKDLNNKIGKTSSLRRLLKHVLTVAFDLSTIDECKIWFKHIFVVLLYPKKNYIFTESLSILKKNMLEIDEVENIDVTDDEDIGNLGSIASRSPFKKIFVQIYDDIFNGLNQQDIRGDDNEFKNEEICNFIINKYCPFLPMWTNIMGILVDPSGDHISNAPVEFSFYLQKYILLKRRSERPGDFIKIDREDNISTLKELRYKYNMFEEIKLDKAKSIKPNLNESENTTTKSIELDMDTSEDAETNLQPEETWEKFDPRKQKAINPMHLLNAKNKKKLTRVTGNIQDIIKVNDEESAAIVSTEHSYCMPNFILQKKDEKDKIDPQSEVNFNVKCDVQSSDMSKSTCQSGKTEKVECLLFRYNDLYSLLYPKFEQFEIGFHNFLNTEDWESLQEGNWLTNIVVDCAILCSIKEYFQNALSLPCQLNRINFKNTLKLLSLKPVLIFIPILQRSHFHLCILKPNTKEFIFIDSLYDSTGRSYYDDLISNKCINNTWKFNTISKRLKQNDSCSCGVFVILYVINFLKDQPMTTLPFSNSLRDNIKSILIRNSDNSSKFCCHCGNHRKNRSKCLLCNYHVCKDCMFNKYNNNFTICKICSKNMLN